MSKLQGFKDVELTKNEQESTQGAFFKGFKSKSSKFGGRGKKVNLALDSARKARKEANDFKLSQAMLL